MESPFRCLIYLVPTDPLITGIDLEELIQGYFISLGDDFVDADVIMTENGVMIEVVVKAGDGVHAVTIGTGIASDVMAALKQVVEIDFAALKNDSVKAFAVPTEAAS